MWGRRIRVGPELYVEDGGVSSPSGADVAQVFGVLGIQDTRGPRQKSLASSRIRVISRRSTYTPTHSTEGDDRPTRQPRRNGKR